MVFAARVVTTLSPKNCVVCQVKKLRKVITVAFRNTKKLNHNFRELFSINKNASNISINWSI